MTHMGDNSPEQVAFKLMYLIGMSEQKGLEATRASADRKWILDTYAECLEAVRGERVFGRDTRL